jgi:hypothetical protein
MNPGLDRLESRQLLSTLVPHFHGVATTAAHADIFVPREVRHHTTGHGLVSSDSAPISLKILLSGAVHGSTQIQGSVTGLNGSGTVGALGAVTSKGSLKSSGAEPVIYSGTVTLVGSTGSVTVDLSGRVFGPTRLGQPINLTYTIAGGTGAFQGASGSGPASLTLNFSTAATSFVLTFGNTAVPV